MNVQRQASIAGLTKPRHFATTGEERSSSRMPILRLSPQIPVEVRRHAHTTIPSDERRNPSTTLHLTGAAARLPRAWKVAN